MRSPNFTECLQCTCSWGDIDDLSRSYHKLPAVLVEDKEYLEENGLGLVGGV